MGWCQAISILLQQAGAMATDQSQQPFTRKTESKTSDLLHWQWLVRAVNFLREKRMNLNGPLRTRRTGSTSIGWHFPLSSYTNKDDRSEINPPADRYSIFSAYAFTISPPFTWITCPVM